MKIKRILFVIAIFGIASIFGFYYSNNSSAHLESIHDINKQEIVPFYLKDVKGIPDNFEQGSIEIIERDRAKNKTYTVSSNYTDGKSHLIVKQSDMYILLDPGLVELIVINGIEAGKTVINRENGQKIYAIDFNYNEKSYSVSALHYGEVEFDDILNIAKGFIE